VLDELARAGEEGRRLLAVERGDDDAVAAALGGDRARDLDQHGDRRGVVVGAVIDLAADRSQVVEVRADHDVAIDVAGDPGEHVGAAAGIDRLLVGIQTGRAQRLDDDPARSIAARRSRPASGAGRAA